MRALLVGCFLIAFCPGYAVAEEKAFNGFFIGVDAGISGFVSSEEYGYDYDNLFAAAADGFNEADVDANANLPLAAIGRLNAGFGKTLAPDFVMSVEAAIQLSSDDTTITSGQFIFPNPNNRADVIRDLTVNTTIDPEAHFSLALQPGYMINENLLVFGSVAYHNLKADISSSTTADLSALNAAAAITESSTSKRFHGIGVGIGAKYLITPLWTMKLAVEWTQFQTRKVTGPTIISTPDEVTFTQVSKLSPSWVNLTVGFAYNF